MICDICGSEMRYTDEAIVEEYRGVETSVTGIPHHVCDQCGNTSVHASELNRLGREQCIQTARGLGLLTPEEIRALRKSFKITQAEFERLVGVSTPTCSRWETGAMLVSGTADKLIRLLRARPELIDVLRNLD